MCRRPRAVPLALLGLVLAFALAACADEERDVPTRKVRLATGVALEVFERGEPGGEPLLFLHGYSESWRSWEPVLPFLPRGLRLVAPSLRGHGESDKPDCCYRQADFAADTLALLDALDVERATLVGFSMGSLVAHKLAVERPERVARLVLVGSAPKVEEDEESRLLGVALDRMTEPLDLAWLREFHQGSAAAPLPPDFLETMAEEARKVPLRVWRQSLAGMAAEDHAARLGEIEAPTLLIWGEEDPLLPPAEREKMARQIPGARLLVLPRLGHAVHWEDPRRFAGELVKFLEATPPAGSRRAP
jgi:non-heme chloroperoxidase